MDKKILFVSYNFPPVGGGGVQRVVKFVKYIHLYGWRPVVLTVRNPSVPTTDNTLQRDVPNTVKIYRAPTLEPSYHFKSSFSGSNKQEKKKCSILNPVKKAVSGLFVPDMQILWWPGLVVSLLRVLRKERPHCIFVTAPPFSSLIPVSIIGRLFSVPVIIDFRDEWAFSRNQWENLSKSRFHSHCDFVLEKVALKACTNFTAATQSYVTSLQSKHKSCTRNSNFIKGVCITNGYDDDDFALSSIEKRTSAKGGKIRIVYSGTVWRATSLKPFLEAILKIEQNSGKILARMEIDIFGRVVPEERGSYLYKALSRIIKVHGYVGHAEVVKAIVNADILLLTLSGTDGAEKIIPGKTFEYMATGNHILAIVPDGEVCMLLRNHYDNFTIASPASVEQIKTAIIRVIQSKAYSKKNTTDISCFSRICLAKQLAEIFDESISKSR